MDDEGYIGTWLLMGIFACFFHLQMVKCSCFDMNATARQFATPASAQSEVSKA